MGLPRGGRSDSVGELHALGISVADPWSLCEGAAPVCVPLNGAVEAACGAAQPSGWARSVQLTVGFCRRSPVMIAMAAGKA